MTEEIKRLKNALDSADSVIIGAGAGLFTSAGFIYSGERFENIFLTLPPAMAFLFNVMLNLIQHLLRVQAIYLDCLSLTDSFHFG